MRLHDAVIVEADAAPYRKFVTRVTRDLLGREVEESALGEWVAQLLAGSSLSTVVSCFLHSQERRERVISEYYRRFLRRAPNAEGLSFWTGLLSAGRTHDEILTAMLASSEYFVASGGTNDAFVQALFRDVFQRKPRDMEADSWVGLLSSQSAHRKAVAEEFVTSEEFRAGLVNEWFRRYLGRNPDAQSISDCLSHLQHGVSPESLQAGILAGREYFGRCLA